MTSAKFLLALSAVGLTAGAGVAQPYVEDSVDVGGPWVGSLAYNSQADVVYGACWYDSLLFALDCGSLQVISTVYGPMFPGQVVYDATDNKAYCPFPLAPPYFAESLLVVDGNTHTRAGAIRLSGTADLVWSPELNRLYVTFGQSDTVAVLDCRADTVVARIGVGAEPRRPCLNRTEGKLYVFTDEDTAISIVDLGSNTFKGRVYPHIELACSWYAEETGRLYVGGSGGLAEIDGQTDSILRSFNFPGREVAIVGLPELNRLMVATSPPGTYDSVYTIDLTTGEVRARLVVGNMSRRFARSPMTGLVYCVTANPGAVAVIAADGCSVMTTLPVGSFPQYVAYSPVHRRVFVSHNNTSYMYVIKDTTGPPAVAEGHRRLAGPCTGAAPTHFRTRTVVSFDPSPGALPLVSVFAGDGRLVRTLPVELHGRSVRVVWDGSNSCGKEVSPGIYFVRSDEGTTVAVVKLR